MTTIAVRDGVMAADTLGYHSEKRCLSKKLFRTGTGDIIGICGNWTDGKVFVDWYDAGANRDEPPKWRLQDGEKVDFQALVLTQDGTYWWSYDLVPDQLLNDFWSIGSGSFSALAAMHCGLNAQDAVLIAMKVDTGSGGDVQFMELQK